MGRKLAPLFFAAFLAYGYNNIFMTLTPSFVVAAGGTLAEAGLQNSVYLAAAVLLRFAFGPAADRWGTKPVMLVGLASFVLGGVLFPLCVEFWQMLLVRCAQAVGLASFWSSATATVSEAAPPQARGRWLGLYRLTTSASLLLGPLVAFGLVKAAGFAACFWGLAGCSAVALRWRYEAPSPPPVRATSGNVVLCEGLVSPVWSCRHSSGRDVCRRHGVRLAVQFWGHLHLSRRNDRKRGMVLHAYWARGPCGQSRCRHPLRSSRCAPVIRRPWAAHGNGRCALRRGGIVFASPGRFGALHRLWLCGRHGVRPGYDCSPGGGGAPGDGACPAAERHRRRHRLRERSVRRRVLGARAFRSRAVSLSSMFCDDMWSCPRGRAIGFS